MDISVEIKLIQKELESVRDEHLINSIKSILAFAKSKKVLPREVHANPTLLKDFQNLIRSQGIETQWPD